MGRVSAQSCPVTSAEHKNVDLSISDGSSYCRVPARAEAAGVGPLSELGAYVVSTHSHILGRSHFGERQARVEYA